MSEWKITALSKVADIERSTIDPDSIADNTTYIGLENIETGGTFVNVRGVSNGELASSKFKFTNQHVLYGKLRPYLAKIARPTFSGICSTDILPILPGSKLDRDYLTHFLRQPSMVELATSRSIGANLPRLSPKVLAEFQIPLPPIAHQKHIAAILDQAEALRSHRRGAIGLLDELGRSVFLEMFGDPVTNPMGWETYKLSDVGILDRGVSKHRPRNAPELLGGNYPLIQTGDVANCERYIRLYKSTYSDIGLKQSRMWKSGTLCITLAANIAKTGILTFDACFPDSVVGFLPNHLSATEYVQSWLSFLQATLEATAPESAQKNINLAILRDLAIPIPPLPLQQEFAQRIAAIEALKATQREAIGQLDKLFASLQHRAFRGEL